MHELGIAEEIVAASLRAAAAHGGRRVEQVHVVVRDDYLDAEVLCEAFAMAATGTDAEAAVLKVEVPPDLCEGCSADSAVLRHAVAVTAIDVTE